jgi:predicted Mrr-cat superfamily restriction endonuclease
MNAYVLRINPGKTSQLQDNLADNRISIGWSYAEGLLNTQIDWYAFREIVHQTYFADRENYRASGNAAGSLWRFVREMKPDDVVLIPSYNADFYVARIMGDVEFLSDKKEDGSAFSRKVEFLNNKMPVPRAHARASIISRLKVYQTCVNCTDILEDIEIVLQELTEGKSIPFDEELRRKLNKIILAEIRTGKIDNFRFEKLLRNLFLKLGARSCDIIPRRLDYGSDLIAEFNVAHLLPITVSIQAKHWQDYNPVGIREVKQLEAGIAADKTNFGVFITSGVYSAECIEYVNERNEDQPRLRLIDGEELSGLLFNNATFELE